MPHSSLSTLPSAVFDAITIKLDLQDLRNLRLTAKDIAAKTTQGCFGSFLENKTITLDSVEQLSEFEYMTEAKQMGCLLRRLTLKYTLPNRKHNANEETLQTHAHRLGRALKNLQSNSGHPCLECVTLACEVLEPSPGRGLIPARRTAGDWEPTWHSAKSLFLVTCLALQSSGLAIRKFDIFGSVQFCSLAYDQLTTALDVTDITVSIEHLERLSLSLSNPVLEANNRDEVADEEKNTQLNVTARALAEDVSRLLRKCPRLEEWELHWFQLSSPHTEAQKCTQCFFDHIVIKLPRLKALSLKGIHTSQAALLAFFAHVPLLSTLVLEGVRLEEGGFRGVFDYVRTRLRYLHFDNLWEKDQRRDRLVHFDIPGEPHFPSDLYDCGPNQISRQGKAVRQVIKYHLAMGMPMSSPQYTVWLAKRRMKFGPL
ncbi:hypothetical protein K461DRAFT_279893 [Myriangium duriaei CBS 260.36]|uniref:F-box domain-containing protein n=1 Tax=Myriangium duriaei CBS 260.36 TaxID=1168546 RepID=A0A9P4MFF5_9PEZI|nr:hypothetical protein K461DRAFT_279893 [Myriangium duriaei CBS 260.36]